MREGNSRPSSTPCALAMSTSPGYESSSPISPRRTIARSWAVQPAGRSVRSRKWSRHWRLGLRFRTRCASYRGEQLLKPRSLLSAPAAARAPERQRPIGPLSEDTFKVEFTASRGLRDKLRQAQDLLRHRLPSGDLASIVESALDLLIEKVKKERFAVGRKPRTNCKPKTAEP